MWPGAAGLYFLASLPCLGALWRLLYPQTRPLRGLALCTLLLLSQRPRQAGSESGQSPLEGPSSCPLLPEAKREDCSLPERKGVGDRG